MSAMPRSIGWIAMRDLAHEWRSSVVSVLAVTVALSPLLILYGLWFGVVETLREKLASDPANLELRQSATLPLDSAWFAKAAAQPGVGFLIPRTRAGNVEFLMENPDDLDAEIAKPTFVPTGPGDPLLAFAGTAPPEGEAAVLSHAAAEKLRVAAGDRIDARFGRIAKDGTRERVRLPLTVAAVLPQRAMAGETAFVPLAILEAIEDYQEWAAVPRYGWEGDEKRPDAYFGFRLYAKGLDDVEPLRQWLRAQKLDVRSAADKIAVTERINRDLGALFTAILGLTLVGYAATVGLNQLACVARKRKVIAVLRLIGYGPGAVRWFPILQGAALAFAGALMALIVYHLMEPIIGALFRDVVEAGGRLTRLPPGHALTALGGSVILAALASSVAGWRAMQISPAENLRDA